MIYDDLERELAALGVAKPKRHVKINQILMLRRRGMSDRQIGQEVGLSADEVRRRRRDALVEDYKAGVVVDDLLTKHGVSRWSLYHCIDEAGAARRREDVEDTVGLYQQHSRLPAANGRRYARLHDVGLPLVSEEVEPPPRDELEDALMHWGELGTAQEYHVTISHVRRWCAYYGITGGQDEKG